MSNDVVSETAAWYSRIAAARVAGIELEELSVALGNVVSSNYFGVGCEEGDVLFARLRHLVKSGTSTLTTCSRQADSLADAALTSERELRESDTANVPRITGER
ncbi:hypothetical protein L5I01_24850 [Gordonia sp. HY442]|uniref:hypothetical protein n=1 Tax=Gordonia zhenghanii TaxID=2911516 RepID=UPI001F47CBF7|nr:hypothetical protein [Gordonia zhenghanii]MCF8606587.1 hypothetical protein [Gordonia zhenghanii]